MGILQYVELVFVLFSCLLVQDVVFFNQDSIFVIFSYIFDDFCGDVIVEIGFFGFMLGVDVNLGVGG